MITVHCHFMLKLEAVSQVAIETAVRVEDAPELSKADMEVYVNKVMMIVWEGEKRGLCVMHDYGLNQ